MNGFARLVDAFFEDQASLGERAWSNYAAAAGITDTLQIEECAMAETRHYRIVAGRRFGDQIDLEGTPTVIVNGLLFAGMPTSELLRGIVDSLRMEGVSTLNTAH